MEGKTIFGACLSQVVMRRSRILIHNFYDYCGGALALSELCRTLRELGYDARLIVTKTNPLNEAGLMYLKKVWIKDSLFTLLHIAFCKCFPFDRAKRKYDYDSFFPRHLIGQKRQWLPIVHRSDIVIYPETVYGNPFDAEHVVRWQLYNYSHFEDKKAYSDSDLFLGYREVFNNRDRTPDVENIHITCFDSSLYSRTNYGERKGKCYIVRKGINRVDLPDRFDGIVIDDLPEVEIVKVFNQCEYCYSYDTQTFYSQIAAICGCKSIVVPEPGKTVTDYRNVSERSYGVAWSDSEEDINNAVNSTVKLLEAIKDNKRNNLIQADRLIAILENRFNRKIAKCHKL